MVWEGAFTENGPSAPAQPRTQWVRIPVSSPPPLTKPGSVSRPTSMGPFTAPRVASQNAPVSRSSRFRLFFPARRVPGRTAVPAADQGSPKSSFSPFPHRRSSSCRISCINFTPSSPTSQTEIRPHGTPPPSTAPSPGCTGRTCSAPRPCRCRSRSRWRGPRPPTGGSSTRGRSATARSPAGRCGCRPRPESPGSRFGGGTGWPPSAPGCAPPPGGGPWRRPPMYQVLVVKGTP